MNSSAQFVLVFGFLCVFWVRRTRRHERGAKEHERGETRTRNRSKTDERGNVNRVRIMSEVGRGETAAQLRISHAMLRSHTHRWSSFRTVRAVSVACEQASSRSAHDIDESLQQCACPRCVPFCSASRLA